jgi:hypothetical protein
MEIICTMSVLTALLFPGQAASDRKTIARNIAEINFIDLFFVKLAFKCEHRRYETIRYCYFFSVGDAANGAFAGSTPGTNGVAVPAASPNNLLISIKNPSGS